MAKTFIAADYSMQLLDGSQTFPTWSMPSASGKNNCLTSENKIAGKTGCSRKLFSAARFQGRDLEWVGERAEILRKILSKEARV